MWLPSPDRTLDLAEEKVLDRHFQVVSHLFNRIERQVLFRAVDLCVGHHGNSKDEPQLLAMQSVRDSIPFNHAGYMTLDVFLILNPHPFLGFGKEKFCNADIKRVAKKRDGAQGEVLLLAHREEIGAIAELFPIGKSCNVSDKLLHAHLSAASL